MSILEITRILARYKFSLQDEKECQNDIESVLKSHNIEYNREYHLSNTDIPDFFLPDTGIVIEIKIKGRPTQIYKQLHRYCNYKNVLSIILVTNKSMGLPKEINTKSCYYINMGMAWL